LGVLIKKSLALSYYEFPYKNSTPTFSVFVLHEWVMLANCNSLAVVETVEQHLELPGRLAIALLSLYPVLNASFVLPEQQQ
jgi:hypothetical protein